MRANWSLLAPALALLVTAGCAITQAQEPGQIALLAPFEGRYREVGYSALYPARLAVTDAPSDAVTLLAVDDGGSVATAVDRARAMASDSRVRAVVVQGYTSAHPDVLRAFGDLPVIIVGYWGTEPVGKNTVCLCHPETSTRLSDDAARMAITEAAQVEAPFTGGEVVGLEGFHELRTELDGLWVATSGAPPSPDFRERVLASDRFAAEPNHLSTLTYDAVRYLMIDEDTHFSQEYDGISGRITFSQGYWANAPLNVYSVNIMH